MDVLPRHRAGGLSFRAVLSHYGRRMASPPPRAGTTTRRRGSAQTIVTAAVFSLGLATPAPSRAELAPQVRRFEGPQAVAEPQDAEPPRTEAQPVPPPRLERWEEKLEVAIGLAPEAAGSPEERDWVERLFRSGERSEDPKTTVRRLRPGVGSPREVCRKGGHDLVVMVGYVPELEPAVVVAHDCRLDLALGTRSIAAVDQPGLVGALWAEHDGLVRQGMKERRRRILGPRARIGIIASVGILVLGGAIAALIATRFRDEKVSLTVGP